MAGSERFLESMRGLPPEALAPATPAHVRRAARRLARRIAAARRRGDNRTAQRLSGRAVKAERRGEVA